MDNTEKILIIPGVCEAELLRTLCWHGKNSFGLRVKDCAELAEIMLIRNGTVTEERLLTSREQIGVMLKALGKCSSGWFSADFNSVGELISALDMLRKRIPGGGAAELAANLPTGEFKEKNEALLEAYNAYIDQCKKDNVIDSISIMRRAAGCGRLDNTEIITLKEYPPEPAELAVIKAACGGEPKEITLAELFGGGAPVPEEPEVFSAYGAINEVLKILDSILDPADGANLDCCTVAVTDTTLYSQLFFEMGQRFGIPMTFGCGVPFGNSTAAGFLKKLDYWCGAGVHGKQALTDLVYDGSFDREKLSEAVLGEKKGDLSKIISLAGDLRLGFDGGVNSDRITKLENSLDKGCDEISLLPALRAFSEELSGGAVYLLKSYCKCRKSGCAGLDKAARSEAAALLSDYEAATGCDPVSMIPELMNRCIWRKARAAGALHITSIDKAVFALRDRLFIAGLSAENIPGSPNENSTVLDCDIALFDSSATAPTSENRIRLRTERALSLASLAASLGNRITLSYSDKRTAELKNANMSSAMPNLYSTLTGKTISFGDMLKLCKQVGFFENRITADRNIGQSFCSGEVIPEKTVTPPKESPVNCFDDREYSPSEIVDFFSCPRKFFLRRILGIREPEDNDEYEVFSAADTGTLIHEVMEKISKTAMSRAECETLCKELMEVFVSRRTPLISGEAENEKRDILELTLSVYDNEVRSPKTVISAEDDIHATHTTGVRLFGKPDRIEQNGSEYLVGDFKTGRHLAQDDSEPKTWLQTMCYAFMENQKDPSLNITKIQYRYPRMKKPDQTRDYDPAELEAILKSFRECLEAQYFPKHSDPDDPALVSRVNPAIKNNDPCKYCKYSTICSGGNKK